MFDVILENGWVIDGSAGPRFRADVAIEGERIAAVGKLTGGSARRRIDVSGLIVCPGFIDTHVHGDLALLSDPKHECAIHQGVTTYIIGQDGCGFAPASPTTIDFMRRYTAGFTGFYPDIEYNWSSVDEYLCRFDRTTSLNVAYLIPNGTVRMEVMGLENRPPTASEIAQMQRLVREGLEQGAVGLSTGLDYIPSLYADTAEIASLCEMLTPVDGVYVTHFRSYGGTKTHEAIDEVYEIGRASGCLLHISHFNVGAETYLPRIDEGLQSGLDITYDTYPYLAGMTFLAMFALPGEVQEGGVDATLQRLIDPKVRAHVHDWLQQPRFAFDKVVLAHVPAEEYRHLEGMDVARAAELTGLPIGELVCELIYRTNFHVSAVVFMGGRTEEDIIDVMRHRCHMAGSDGIFTGSYTHPRGWGAFARFLGYFGREKQAWSLEEAISHLSYHAARRYRLGDRGLVRQGMTADLVVFDPQTIADRSTYDNPRELATGVHHVFVGGKLTLENVTHTGITNGRPIRRS